LRPESGYVNSAHVWADLSRERFTPVGQTEINVRGNTAYLVAFAVGYDRRFRVVEDDASASIEPAFAFVYRCRSSLVPREFCNASTVARCAHVQAQHWTKCADTLMERFE